MPELIEVEYYRRLAERVVGRRIKAVEASDTWFLKGGLTSGEVAEALAGRRVLGTRRIGKLLMLDLDARAPVLGLRFGMTGRLVVDDAVGISDMAYSSSRDNPAWDRFRLDFPKGGHLRIQDPRRLGGVELDPDESALGPDAWTITTRNLGLALANSHAPLKARLLDQSRVAGIGNLICDETLWRAGIDPDRVAGSLSPDEVKVLGTTLRRTIAELARRGGSHTGQLQVARQRGSLCPRDGTPLQRRTIGGRTTYSCPHHQH